MSSGHAGPSVVRAPRSRMTLEAPPVVELALAVEFVPQPTAVLGARHLARLADQWSVGGGQVEEVMAVPPEFRRDPDDGVPLFSALVDFPGVRFRVSHDGGSLLVQAQNDRLVVNWRRVDAALRYPGFDAILERFVSWWADLTAVVRAEGPVQPLTAEVTYVNLVERQVPDVQPFALLTDDRSGPDDVQVRFQYQRPLARAEVHGGGAVVVTADPVRRSAHHLTISTRLALHATPGAADVTIALASAHDSAVEEFHRAVRPSYLQVWGAGR